MKKLIYTICCLTGLLSCQDMQSQKETIQTTKSGFQYNIAKDVAGTNIKGGQYALLHSRMMHKDSVISDTRINPGRPTVVKVEAAAAQRKGGSAPVQDLLELMSIGDSARLYYPVDSFPTKPPRLKDFKEVTYDLVVVDVFETEEELQTYMTAEREKVNAPLKEAQSREKEVADAMAVFYDSFKRGEKDALWQTTPTGLKYIVLEKGPSGLKANPGQIVRVSYYGFLVKDGSLFDNSYKRGDTYDFPVGKAQVMKGWDEAFALLGKGDKAVLYVPTALAYGERGFPGFIGPNEDLLFYVELVGFDAED